MSNSDKNRTRADKDGSLGFIIVCLLYYNFKSFKRFLIYIYHFSDYINLNKKRSDQFTDEEIIEKLGLVFKRKIEKQYLYLITGLSKNTFNKHFKDFFKANKFSGRRKFTIYETYRILSEWQGDGKWAMPHAVKKERLARILNKKDYKKLANEFNLSQMKSWYKNFDTLSPKQIKKHLQKIEELDEYKLDDEEKVEEQILKYEKFEENSKWFFIIFLIFTAIENKRFDNS